MNDAEVTPQRACYRPIPTIHGLWPVKGATCGQLLFESRDMPHSAFILLAQKRGGRRRGLAGRGGRGRDRAAGMVGSARGGHTEAAGAMFRCKCMRAPQCDFQSQGRWDVSVCPAFLSFCGQFPHVSARLCSRRHQIPADGLAIAPFFPGCPQTGVKAPRAHDRRARGRTDYTLGRGGAYRISTHGAISRTAVGMTCRDFNSWFETLSIFKVHEHEADSGIPKGPLRGRSEAARGKSFRFLELYS